MKPHILTIYFCGNGNGTFSTDVSISAEEVYYCFEKQPWQSRAPPFRAAFIEFVTEDVRLEFRTKTSGFKISLNGYRPDRVYLLFTVIIV